MGFKCDEAEDGMMATEMVQVRATYCAATLRAVMRAGLRTVLRATLRAGLRTVLRATLRAAMRRK